MHTITAIDQFKTERSKNSLVSHVEKYEKISVEKAAANVGLLEWKKSMMKCDFSSVPSRPDIDGRSDGSEEDRWLEEESKQLEEVAQHDDMYKTRLAEERERNRKLKDLRPPSVPLPQITATTLEEVLMEEWHARNDIKDERTGEWETIVMAWDLTPDFLKPPKQAPPLVWGDYEQEAASLLSCQELIERKNIHQSEWVNRVEIIDHKFSMKKIWLNKQEFFMRKGMLEHAERDWNYVLNTDTAEFIKLYEKDIAALSIQKVWRGHNSRQRTGSRVGNHQDIGSMVSDDDDDDVNEEQIPIHMTSLEAAEVYANRVSTVRTPDWMAKRPYLISALHLGAPPQASFQAIGELEQMQQVKHRRKTKHTHTWEQIVDKIPTDNIRRPSFLIGNAAPEEFRKLGLEFVKPPETPPETPPKPIVDWDDIHVHTLHKHRQQLAGLFLTNKRITDREVAPSECCSSTTEQQDESKHQQGTTVLPPIQTTHSVTKRAHSNINNHHTQRGVVTKQQALLLAPSNNQPSKNINMVHGSKRMAADGKGISGLPSVYNNLHHIAHSQSHAKSLTQLAQIALPSLDSVKKLGSSNAALPSIYSR